MAKGTKDPRRFTLFDKDAWPDFADPVFASRVYEYYDVQLAWL